MTLRAERPHVEDQPVTLDFTGETSPYPFFEYMRRTDPVWHGSLADHSQMPEELRPNDEWVLFGYDGLFQAFRDDRIFTSAAYDKTIGLVMGHMILAMGGKEHQRRRRSSMGQRDLRRRRSAQGRGHTRNDFERNVVSAQAFDLFPGAAEDQRIAPL